MQLKQLVEVLEPYQIDETAISDWTESLGLELEVVDGEERFLPQHIQLFKSVKKHLGMGRTLEEIKRLLVLPARRDSVIAPETDDVEENTTLPEELMPTSVEVKNPISAQSKKIFQPPVEMPVVVSADSETVMPDNAPEPLTVSAMDDLTLPELDLKLPEQAPLRLVPDIEILESDQPSVVTKERVAKPQQAAGVASHLKRLASPQLSFESALSQADGVTQETGLLILVDRLVNDKDDLAMQVGELSRYNAHLNKVNQYYKRQIEELATNLKATETRAQELERTLDARVRLYQLDDKAKIQQQVIQAEKACAVISQDAEKAKKALSTLQAQVNHMQSPTRFIGTWLENATLNKVHFDAFGINIPENRSRMFRLGQSPERVYGQTAIIETVYDYRTNTLWKRHETLILSIHPTQDTLMGELVIEYMLEGKTVAKASYAVTCQKQANASGLPAEVQ